MYNIGLETSFKTGDIEKTVEMAPFSPMQFRSKSPSSCAATGKNTHANHSPSSTLSANSPRRSSPPKTGYTSKTRELAGKLSRIIEQNSELYILEHKTTSKADDDYFNRLRVRDDIYGDT